MTGQTERTQQSIVAQQKDSVADDDAVFRMQDGNMSSPKAVKESKRNKKGSMRQERPKLGAQAETTEQTTNIEILSDENQYGSMSNPNFSMTA